MLLGVELCRQSFASLSRHEILDQVGRWDLSVPTDGVRFAHGPFNGFPDLVEVEIEFTERCVSGWPRPGGADLADVVLCKRSDRVAVLADVGVNPHLGHATTDDHRALRFAPLL